MNDAPETAQVRKLFGIDTSMRVPVATPPPELAEHVPQIDPAYVFDPDVTLAILSGFAHNRRVLVQGMHGTGKSTHVEQVAARLGWPCVRVNLDGHLSRLDFVGRDTVVLRDGVQVTEFAEGILPWALQRPVALLLDEYDAGRPEVMFVLQRVLEREGSLTLLDQSRVLHPHPGFRLFGTANTVGLGNTSGLYHGVQRLNHAQLDRWSVVAALDYLPAEREAEIVVGQVPGLVGRDELVSGMVQFAALTRSAFAAGDLSTLMSPRTVIAWGENVEIFGDVARSLRLSFTNKCAEDERALVAQLFQRCFDADLDDVLPATA
ncbi:AAA domain-containing protein [Flexivirga sp. ID2601S]|uniref:AAA domain-containing protein n=1 Tax=Flexivirga aerilata TaxID=1656889 RepID=A0A849AFK3_9MICO|nr:AAA family ATPase [Flexivirga aerilata]NNG38623.1 AAA domain-containing protein [Flexivirga aerilata]